MSQKRTFVQRQWDDYLFGQPRPAVITEEQWALFVLHVVERYPFTVLAEFCGKSSSYVHDHCRRVIVAMGARSY